MRSGITRNALQCHRASLLGPAATQCLAGAVVSTMVTAAHSLNQLPSALRARASVADAIETTGVFVGITVYLSIIIGGVTMNLAASGQLRDLALLRTIGATPAQVRRSLALQSATIALPSSVVGALLGVPAAWAWLAVLRHVRVVPQATTAVVDPRGLALAVGIVLVTSVVGTVIAVVRTSRLSPASALTEAITGLRSVRPVRTVVGTVLIVGGVVLSAVLATVAPNQVGDAAVFVMLAECVGVGLVGPVVLRSVTQTIRPFARGIVRVAVDDVAAMTRKLSAALIPTVLAATFAGIKIAAHTTAGTGIGPADEPWADYSGTAIYCSFAGIAALNCFVTVMITRRQTLAAMQLAGAPRRTLIAIVTIESLIVAAVAVTVAAAIAVVTLSPILHHSVGVWFPRVGPLVLVGWATSVTGVVALGMVVPVVQLSGTPPIRTVMGAE
jgi:putative ABC transport system permease protein